MKSKGLGDTIAKITNATGIDKLTKKVLGEDCGCNERKEILNKIFPYARPFTEDEIKIYEEVLPSIKKGMINGKEQISLLKIYNKVFNTNQQPTSCTACIKPVLTKLKKVYQNSCKV